MKREIICAHCGGKTMLEAGAINRAQRKGMRLYCNRFCAGMGRRLWKSDEQKKQEKREYDAHYRIKNRDKLKQKKRTYHLATYNPERAAVERKKRSAQHNEYCRRPEYKNWKRDYDKTYRAKRVYGPLAEAFLVLLDLNSEINRRSKRYDIYIQNETLCRTQKRRRQDAPINTRDRHRASEGVDAT